MIYFQEESNEKAFYLELHSREIAEMRRSGYYTLQQIGDAVG